MVAGVLILLVCFLVGASILAFGIFAALLPEKFDGLFSLVLGDRYMLDATPSSRVSVWRTVGLMSLVFDVVVLAAFLILALARILSAPPA